MKFQIQESEWYPVYSISEDSGWGTVSEISPEEVDRIKKAFAEFNECQDILQAKVETYYLQKSVDEFILSKKGSTFESNELYSFLKIYSEKERFDALILLRPYVTNNTIEQYIKLGSRIYKTLDEVPDHLNVKSLKVMYRVY
jgi:hypothetical protein